MVGWASSGGLYRIEGIARNPVPGRAVPGALPGDQRAP
jgi:hypothetical protein